ncbi:MAG: FtsX-like permease family protein [Proteobacteria bacterium]|nr:FtsX-like permease family protein [Pseudomonadota bacterium]
MLHFRFIFRQINGSRNQAIIFIFCVALSLLILTSLGGFSSSVRRSMLQDARQLHGADITVHSHYPFSEPLLKAIHDYEQQGIVQGALVHKFYSMARNSRTEKSILSDLKVVEKGYPFYGRVTLLSGREFSEVLKEGAIIVDQVLLDRLQAVIGDTLQIGSALLTIVDVVTLEPDRPVSFFSFGPRIFIAAEDLEKLELIKKGSRIQFSYLLQVHDSALVDRLAEELSASTVKPQENVKTFRNADSRIKRFFENFLFFLNLVGMFTLVLAGIGIQTSLYAMLRESEYTIAVMKSVGATNRFIVIHFLAMVMVLGTAGTFLGLILSSLLQLYFPTLFAGILPANVTLAISWNVVFEGLVLGTIVVGLFSFLPLQRIRNLKPSFIFRKEIGKAPRGILSYSAVLLIVLFFVGLVIWQLEDVKIGLYFMLGLCALIGMTALIAQGLMFFMKKTTPRSLILRQAFRGLFRPGNATRAIIITLSAALAVIFSIYLIEQNLRATFIEAYPPNLPNAYFLDIQSDQKKEFADILGIEAEYFPVVRARLLSINNKPVNRDQEREKKGDNMAREFNLTYRDVLLKDEQMAEGDTLFGHMNNELANKEVVPVSVLDTVAEIGDINVGDLLVFKVQGLPLKARVTSIRTRTESKVRPFFYFVFQEELLKDAPQTIFSSVRIDRAQLAVIQNRLAATLPNVSVIDIASTVEILAGIMRKMSSIIQFFTSFSIVAGLLIVISSIFATRMTRIREAVYFKILGANYSFVVKVFTYENLIIAFSSALLAGLISHVGSWIVCRQVFSIAYQPLLSSTLVMIAGMLVIVVGVGLGASVSILQQKPINYLRDERQD